MNTCRYLALHLILIATAHPSIVLGASALEEWKAVPKLERDCVEFAATAGNTSLKAIIAAGVRPTDTNVATVIAACAILTKPLRQSFDCVLTDVSGEIVNTVCREFFAVQRKGEWQEVSPSEAMRLNIIDNQQIATMNTETPEGAARRQSVIAAALEDDALVDENEVVSGAEQEEAAQGDLNTEAAVQPQLRVDRTTSAPDWLLGDWCVGGSNEANAADVNTDAAAVLSCSENQACSFGSYEKPWDKVEWTSSDEGGAKFSLFRYGETALRLRLKVPDGVNGTSYQCRADRQGPNAMSQVCDGGFYGQEKAGKSEQYVRCRDHTEVAAAVSDGAKNGEGIVADRTYSGTFYCLGDVYSQGGQLLITGDPEYGVAAVDMLLNVGGDINPYAFEAFQKGALNCQPIQWSLEGSQLTVERAAASRQGLIVRLGNRSIWGFVAP